ncbi:hypothetical protein M4951_18485 [Blastopirellula sp. J2-11]|uniref:hypothetical protein n=1 Tax=Blastopirellula sp. J2-11 TaxID=2943192 RepID=UPI0021C6DFDD|nr:hypothetical protein [Blastopirellula sp. J2-11]UUO05357.1 hypothetical protein M4951_18485 [Blastopirellula sp. J2-11]
MQHSSFLKSSFGLVALASFLACAVGCGDDSMHPVQGHIHFVDGSPLKTGRVVLDGGDTNTSSWGLIHPDGSFQVGTLDVDDGVPAGVYRVYIENAMSLPPDNWGDRDFTPKLLIHPKFMDPEQSGLSIEVPAKSTSWEIIVEKPPKSR